ncbi:BAQ_1a_G0020300.mRNA.1.CDS.1 [Saccharomyces cerevisiae]|nr:BAQ_1a_G0020300.mRNA.1.CDS.1 [Saccharomyces cerevisiae]CAI4490931.1 BAM_G0017460.mRNA.1.CDS.1 [Saccharomyces cerevisiae]CAI7120196.1 BAM_G0017460.mRNA.1.CDS.1 [Saccharomyces cerevisiae]CAI7121616.1 BAQ_1a_G0020300.mRNA.1.CDS.1 [Saccharomyces cerevisiae]
MNSAGRVHRSRAGSRGHAAILPLTMASFSVARGIRSLNVYDDTDDELSILTFFSAVRRNRLTSSLPPILSARCSSACFSVRIVLPLSLTISISALMYSTNSALGGKPTGAFSIQTNIEQSCGFFRTSIMATLPPIECPIIMGPPLVFNSCFVIKCFTSSDMTS